jgi:hypothetical protein
VIAVKKNLVRDLDHKTRPSGVVTSIRRTTPSQ